MVDVIQAGGRVVRQATGHLVFYRADGRRFLATDPAGNPLHECEWGTDTQVSRFSALEYAWIGGSGLG